MVLDFDDALKAGGIEFIKEGGLKPLESIVKEAVKPVGDILDPIADALKTVTEPTKEFLSEANQTIREELQGFDESVLQPITKPVGDVLSAADTAVRDALPDIDLPSVDLPDSGLGMLTGSPQPLNATKTTDSLFRDELFKFKTKVEINPFELIGNDKQLTPKEIELLRMRNMF